MEWIVDVRRSTSAGRRGRILTLTAATLAALLTLSACSSSKSGGGDQSAGTNGTASAQPPSQASGAASGGSGGDVAAASAALKVLSKPSVPMAKPTTPVNPGSHKIAVISVGQGTPGASDTARLVQQGIKDIGWSAPPTYDGKFQPSVASGFIQTALTNGAQGIILVSITPATVASALQVAEQKKVPVVCILCGPPNSFSQFPGMIGVEPSPEKTGVAQAQYVIAKSDGKAKVWIYEDKEFLFTAAQNAATEQTFKSQCPDCQVHVVQMKSGDETAPGIPVLASVLAANPKGSIDYIVAPYDGAAARFATYLQQRGRDEVGVVGYAALPIFYDQIAAGSPPSAKATISIPLPYMAYTALDELARKFAGTTTWNANELGVSLLTTENKSAYDAKSPWVAPGFDVVSFFKKLWNK